METGLLYVVFNKTIRDPETNDLLYKIGITKNSVDIRYHSLGLKMPGQFETLFAYRLENYTKAEQAIQQILHKYRENGEWFKLSQKELDHIRMTCELMGGILVTDEIEKEIKQETERNDFINTIEPKRVIENRQFNSTSAKPINPNFPCKVILFNISNTITEGKNVYEATRAAWKITEKYRYVSEYEYVVGLQHGISLGGYRVTRWIRIPINDDRYKFEGEEILEFKGFSWHTQINVNLGYWQRGQHFIVEFDGNGQFRLIRPNDNKWRSCLQSVSA